MKGKMTMNKEDLLEHKQALVSEMHDDLMALEGKATVLIDDEPFSLTETAMDLKADTAELIDVLKELEQLEEENTNE